MLVHKYLSQKITVDISLAFLLFEFLILITTKNHLSKAIIITHAIIILTLLIWFIKNLNFSNIIRKISHLKYIFLFFIIIILLYLPKINYSQHLNEAISCKQINSIIIKFDCSYSYFYLLMIAILFFLLFYFNKLKIDLIKVFIWLGLGLIIVSLVSLINFYLISIGIVKINYLSNIFPFRGNYNFYFQFLPFAIEGKRSNEIIFFSLSYIAILLFLIKKEQSKLNYLSYLIFTASFLTYSKNTWLSLILSLLLIFFFSKKKLFILKIFYKSIILVCVSILIINFIQFKIDLHTLNSKNPRKHYTSLINYTAIKFGYRFDYEKNKVIGIDYLSIISGELKNIEENKKYLDKTLDINYLFDSTHERKLIYKTIINQLNIKNIFFGNGLNSIDFKLITEKRILYILNAESQIVQILFEIGFIGLLICMIIIILILKILDFNSKFIFLTLLSLCIFNSYQENLLFWILFGSIIGTGARNKLG
jgi:hypothetical protein